MFHYQKVNHGVQPNDRGGICLFLWNLRTNENQPFDDDDDDDDDDGDDDDDDDDDGDELRCN